LLTLKLGGSQNVEKNTGKHSMFFIVEFTILFFHPSKQ